MNTEEILDIVKDLTNHIRFNEKAKYSVSQWYMAIEDLLELYIDKNTELQKEKEKNKKLEEGIIQIRDKLEIADYYNCQDGADDLTRLLEGEAEE